MGRAKIHQLVMDELEELTRGAVLDRLLLSGQPRGGSETLAWERKGWGRAETKALEELFFMPGMGRPRGRILPCGKEWC